MVRQVVWTRAAADDAEDIAAYIAKDSPFYAASFVREALEAGHSLDRFSERGRVVPEAGEEHIRELRVYDYRLLYAVEKSRVIILGLIHGKRDLAALWNKRKG